MESWLCQQLSNLGLDISEENARYMLSIEGDTDIKEYMYGLLDQSKRECREFVTQLIARKNGKGVPNQPKDRVSNSNQSKGRSTPPISQRLDPPAGVTAYQKKEEEDLVSPVRPQREKFRSPEDDGASKNGPKDVNKKKAPKFVPLYSEEGMKQDVVLLKGRHSCECQATKHKLINNCLSCGRIVCEQEGSGPCMFCSCLVCSKEELEILSRNTKKSEKLRHVLENLGGGGKVKAQRQKETNDSMKKAQEYKDRLLEYDRTSARRTQVIDDDSDYFSIESRWLSPAQREKLEAREQDLRDKQNASRRTNKVTLDFAGRRVIDAAEDVSLYREGASMSQEILDTPRDRSTTAAYAQSLTSPAVFKPVFIMPEISYSKKVTTEVTGSEVTGVERLPDDKRRQLRLQDPELREMSDVGACLSMHQPWASLLVAGVKIHEGRTWYTPHRGRLWIASTAKVSPPADIAECVNTYKYICPDSSIKFPTAYPTGCLLGCVDVVDCIDQDTYRKQFPEGESMSPYVLICVNPQPLLLKFPIQGKHKIYQLDRQTHQAAKKGINACI